ncbi:LysR family transcriptional regulator [Altererythrobacter marinus]|uniref:LysR family transcriptional regulator n=1 Tax=Pelagerythrobacter marinus TaxID=538382 RepID=A0ABW9V1B7_9SPHN|nr:LysR family transcriptional regulator [Alphaproteobacteria bacterium]MBU0866148.1 LysR family transcriptional regulator [Alphaproteobacteria bacterium]MBU1825658.1 LysR family transcriptional regulator [Alphaproteobacteria bacterium]MBU2090835.1 LysR family transcriptional regulator [Alphaproteobacteria bacterium]MXO69996.1 LysR family transcriptional regulator [Pelagerythrobacter marinus]
MIDGKCLAAFVAISETRSFSRAADVLGIAQSVVSKRLRRLEDQLGVELIDRSAKVNIHATNVGQLFLEEARETLRQLDRAERSGRNLARDSSGPLSIGFVFSAAMNGSLVRILSRLRAALPELTVLPRLMETPEQLAALEAGSLDMALVRPRPSYLPGGTATVICSEALMVCMSSTHRLVEADEIISRELSGERFIVPQFREQVGLNDSVRRLAKAGGIVMPEILSTEDFVSAACLAAAGVGLVLAPESLCNLGLKGVVFRPLGDYSECLETVLVCRKDAPTRAANQILTLFDKRPAIALQD